MLTRRRLVTAFGAAVLILVLGAATSVKAFGDDLHRTMYLTFSGPVEIPGAELSAGTYIFELAEPMMSQSPIRVLSRDRSTLYLLAFTHRVQRPERLREGQFVTVGEASPGKAPRIVAWWPAGEAVGHEFVY